VFEYRQAEEVRDAFSRHQVRYLFLGKSGAILLGFPDTTQDADVYVERSPENGEAVVRALPTRRLTPPQEPEENPGYHRAYPAMRRSLA